MESNFFLPFPNGNQVTTSTCKTMSPLPNFNFCLQVVPPTPKKKKKPKPRQPETCLLKKKTPPRAAGSVSPRDLLVLIGPQLPRPPNKQTATHSSHPEDGVCACPPCVFVVSLSTKLADVRAIRETTPGIRPSGKERKYGTAGPGKYIGPGPPALPAQTRVCVRDDQMLPRGTSTTGTRARRRTARCVCYPTYCHPSGSDRVESSRVTAHLVQQK